MLVAVLQVSFVMGLLVQVLCNLCERRRASRCLKGVVALERSLRRAYKRFEVCGRWDWRCGGRVVLGSKQRDGWAVCGFGLNGNLRGRESSLGELRRREVSLSIVMMGVLSSDEVDDVW